MNNSFDILFEQVNIGPVVAPNRFYQVPHCNGMGYRMPRALAEMRRIKAEGGGGELSVLKKLRSITAPTYPQVLRDDFGMIKILQH